MTMLFSCEPWPLVEGCGTVPVDPAARDDPQQVAVEAATETLWRLTAGRFGLCPEDLRPARRACLPGPGVVTLAHGRWWNVPCSCAHGTTGCGCDWPSEMRVPGPVWVDADHPVSVTVDGQPFGQWRIYDRNALVRTDGQGWPVCQDLTVDATQPDTFSVSYWRGQPVPVAGQRAVSILASEMHKACSGDRSCKLPSRVSTIQREGVSYTMIDPQDFLAEGRVGLYDVDLWIATVNPRHQASPSQVWTPDAPATYRTGR